MEETPDRSHVRDAIDRLVSTLAACGLWTARRLDTAVNAAMVSAGTAGGGALVAWLSGQRDRIVQVVDAAERWLTALP